jgi:hypothetical protein
MISAFSFFQNPASADNQLFRRMSGNPQSECFVTVGAGPFCLTHAVAEAWIKAQVEHLVEDHARSQESRQSPKNLGTALPRWAE